MLNDEERAAYELAVERLRESAINNTGPIDHWETMFAAGIAYAQTQQAARIAQARADALEECAIGLEVRMANVIRANSRGSRVTQAASFAADMLQAEAAAIRARKDGQ